jgi:hypothetical protein
MSNLNQGEPMNHTYICHLCEDPGARIACETQSHSGGMSNYPVLRIGTASFFPTVEQLKAIKHAIATYLEQNQAGVDLPDVILDCDLCGEAITPENAGQSTWDEFTGEGTTLCKDCTGKASREAQRVLLPLDIAPGGQFADAPDGSTYTHVPTGQPWVRKRGVWELGLPF